MSEETPAAPTELPAKRLMPSAATFASTGTGALLGPIVVWGLGAFTGVVVPPEIAATIGAFVGNMFGYFFEGGRKAS